MSDIRLDTGLACTVIRNELIPEETKTAQVEISVGEHCYMAEVVVSKILPVSVLLAQGWFAQQSCGNEPTGVAMAVVARTQKNCHDQEVIALERQDRESETACTPVVQILEPEEAEEFLVSKWDDDLLKESPMRKNLTRWEKHENHQTFFQERAKLPLDLPTKKMRELQHVNTNNVDLN